MHLSTSYEPSTAKTIKRYSKERNGNDAIKLCFKARIAYKFEALH